MSLKSTRSLYAVIAVLIISITGCRKDPQETPVPSGSVSKAARSYSGDKIHGYFTLLCRVSKSTPGFFPPQVARAYGYVGIANYEAVVPGIAGAEGLAGQLNGLAKSDLPTTDTTLPYNWSISSNAAVAEVIRNMFDLKITAANKQSVDSMEAANLAALSTGENADVVTRSIKYGKDVAAAIYKYSLTDGGHQSYLDPFQLPFTMATDSFCWVPTSAVTTPVSPFWGSNRPFVQADITNTQSGAPLAFSSGSSSSFYKEAMDVYNQVKNNTLDQVEITKYWADDPFNTCTPTGHTFNIMIQLLQEGKATLEKSSVAFARLAIAENDAFICCWKGKYKYSLIRPVSYIKKYIDPAFTTVIGTPAFPAYTSGHSCEMGAGSRIFSDMFTDGSGNYSFTDYSQLQYGFPARNYSNFAAMAEECAASRFYGGIHYQMDNVKGLQIGRAIGDNVNHMLLWPQDIK